MRLSLYFVIKRLFDILASGLALIVLLPIWIIAIIGIEISDPGLFFYMADRVGQNNKHFYVNKISTMKNRLKVA